MRQLLLETIKMPICAVPRIAFHSEQDQYLFKTFHSTIDSEKSSIIL